MSQETNTSSTAPPVSSQSWSEVWISAITKPSVATFESFVQDTNATSRRAYKWVFVSTLIGYTFSVLIGLVLAAVFGIGLLEGPDAAIALGTALISSLLILACGGPIVALLGVLSLMIWAGIIQSSARSRGGTGTYSELAFAFATFVAPLSLIMSVLGSIPFVNYLNYFIMVYEIVLSVIAVKAVHTLAWGKATSSVFFPLVLVLILVAVVVVCILIILGPVVGNVFSDIISTPGP